jgi:replicative DNA helicase
MTRAQLLDRLSASAARVPYGSIRARTLTQEQKASVCGQIVGLMSGDRLNLFDAVRSVSGILAEIGRVGAKIAFIDYIQKVRPDERRARRNEEIESVMDRLKEGAVKLGCHICALSQINRDGSGNPDLENLKESGALEEGGDIVMLLKRENEFNSQSLSKQGELIVAKHKFGRDGFINLRFDGELQRFEDVGKAG